MNPLSHQARPNRPGRSAPVRALTLLVFCQNVVAGPADWPQFRGPHQPMRAVRLENAAGDVTPPALDQTNAAIAWVHPRHGNYLQTPLVNGDLLFGCTDHGLVTCFDARAGTIHYRERLRGRSQGFSASPVAGDGKLFFTGE